MSHVAEICLYGSHSSNGYAFIAVAPKKPIITQGYNDAGTGMDGRYTTRTEAMWAASDTVYHQLGIKTGMVRVYDVGGSGYAEFDIRRACPTAGDAKWIRAAVPE